MPRLGGVRPAGARHLRGAPDRPAGCVQPAARADAAPGRDAHRALLDALGLSARPDTTTRRVAPARCVSLPVDRAGSGRLDGGAAVAPALGEHGQLLV